VISYMAENKDRLLFRLNPFIKIIILVLVTVIITFDYMPYVPGIFLFTILTLTWIFGGIPLSRLLTILAPFLAVSLGFIIFTLLSTGLQVNAVPDVTILNFGWSYKNIYISLSLGLRILAIVSFSVSFVLTTNPVELIISLIKYFRLPYRIGYPVLAAYRFLPSIEEELQQIRFAHQVRGAHEEKGWLNKIAKLKLYPIPLLATAVRRGERVSNAMESRAFGAYPERTYYRQVQLTGADLTVLAVAVIFCTTVLLTLNHFNLLGLSLGFNLN
jgi:energy-coupling factor transport system permease protein